MIYLLDSFRPVDPIEENGNPNCTHFRLIDHVGENRDPAHYQTPQSCFPLAYNSNMSDNEEMERSKGVPQYRQIRMHLLRHEDSATKS